MQKFSIVVHGGAGTILRNLMSAEMEAAYTAGLRSGLDAGYRLLEKGGSATDAVLAATIALEDNPLFNAGKGSVFGKDGKQEMDAAIMEGRELRAGAVGAVRRIANPVALAYAVMMQSQHVMLNGTGANEFAKSIGMEEKEEAYFFTDFRYKQWQDMQGSDETALDHSYVTREKKFGTVGAAACDGEGNIAAATSTGGMTNKQWGRVGDTPLIGCGTYANNKTCAISCTGHGELFIRAVAAYDVSCLMEYKGLSLHEAMDIVVNDKLVKIEGEGGMIGVDAAGNTAMLFNSEGMYRGSRTAGGEPHIAIYK